MNPFHLVVLLAVAGGLLMLWALRARMAHGLGVGETVALDDLVLYSERLKLVGRPDRIVRQGPFFIPEEWKPSAKRAYPGDRLQLGLYLLLIEERFGVRPPFGVVVICNGKRIEVENTEKLRAEVLSIADQIRNHRRRLADEITVSPPAWKYRTCGQRPHCRQAPAEVSHDIALWLGSDLCLGSGHARHELSFDP